MSTLKEPRYCDLRTDRRLIEGLIEEGTTDITVWKDVFKSVFQSMNSCELIPTQTCNLFGVRNQIDEILNSTSNMAAYEILSNEIIKTFDECSEEFGDMGTNSHKPLKIKPLKKLNDWQIFLKQCNKEEAVKFLPKRDRDGNKVKRESREVMKICGERWKNKK